MVELADASKYRKVDAEVVGTSFILNTEATIDVIDITVGDPFDWSVLLVGLEKRICISFDNCSFPFYECLFTRIGLRLPFFDIKVAFLKHLKVSLSQLHLGV